MGRLDEVLQHGEFWRCLECYGCQELCFQRYSMIDIFRTAKHLAVERGLEPAGTAKGMAAFRKAGKLAEASAAPRSRLGLPEVSESGSDELEKLLGEDLVPASASGAEVPSPEEEYE
jgi:heterodisulfide reductase subunit C